MKIQLNFLNRRGDASLGHAANHRERDSRYYATEFATEGIVIAAHADTNMVDVKLAGGVVQNMIPVISREWAGNVGGATPVGTGERDMPPVGALVTVLFFDSAHTDARVIGSGLSPFSQRAGPLQKQTLMVSGQERVYKRLTEAGWTFTRNKSTGVVSITNAVGTLNGFSLTIDATGNVAVQLPTGSVLSLNGSTKTFVTTADLQSAINGLITTIKGHMHTSFGTVSAELNTPPLAMTVPGTTTVKTGG